MFRFWIVGIDQTALSMCRFHAACVFRLVVVSLSNSVCSLRRIADLRTIGVGEFGESVGIILDPNPSSDVRSELFRFRSKGKRIVEA